MERIIMLMGIIALVVGVGSYIEGWFYRREGHRKYDQAQELYKLGKKAFEDANQRSLENQKYIEEEGGKILNMIKRHGEQLTKQ